MRSWILTAVSISVLFNASAYAAPLRRQDATASTSLSAAPEASASAASFELPGKALESTDIGSVIGSLFGGNSDAGSSSAANATEDSGAGDGLQGIISSLAGGAANQIGDKVQGALGDAKGDLGNIGDSIKGLLSGDVDLGKIGETVKGVIGGDESIGDAIKGFTGGEGAAEASASASGAAAEPSASEDAAQRRRRSGWRVAA